MGWTPYNTRIIMAQFKVTTIDSADRYFATSLFNRVTRQVIRPDRSTAWVPELIGTDYRADPPLMRNTAGCHPSLPNTPWWCRGVWTLSVRPSLRSYRTRGIVLASSSFVHYGGSRLQASMSFREGGQNIVQTHQAKKACPPQNRNRSPVIRCTLYRCRSV